MKAFCFIGVFNPYSKFGDDNLIYYQKVLCEISSNEKRMTLVFKDDVYFYLDNVNKIINIFLEIDSTSNQYHCIYDTCRISLNDYDVKTKVKKIGPQCKVSLKSISCYTRPEFIKDTEKRENFYKHKQYTLANFLRSKTQNRI